MTDTPAPPAGEATSRSLGVRRLLYGLVALMLLLFLVVLASDRLVARRAAGGAAPAFPSPGQPGVVVVSPER